MNYKLKVQAALDEKFDTLSSFKKEFLSYRDQQIRPSFVSDADVENEVVTYYNNLVAKIGPKGLFTASHILLSVPQKAEKAALDAAKVRIDSIYNAIKGGADLPRWQRNIRKIPARPAMEECFRR